MNSIGIQDPKKMVGTVVKLVCDDKVLFEDVVCSVMQSAPNKVQLNFPNLYVSLEEEAEL